MSCRNLWLLLFGFWPFTPACGGRDVAWTPLIEDDPRGAYLMAWSDGDTTWVVGGQPEAGVVWRGGVDGLEELALPAGTPLLNWVHGTGPDDVWVAGLRGARLRWDGIGWTDHSEATEAAFWGVHAVTRDQAWAVGGVSAWGGERAMMRRWDGTTWADVTLPPALGDSGNLFKVHHDGERAWACGFRGGVGRMADDGQVEQVPTTFSGDIVTVHGQPGRPPVLVGGRGSGQVLQVQGDLVVPLVSAPSGLSGVHAYGDDRALVVGERGFSAIVDLQAGTLTPALLPTDHVLHGVFIGADGVAWAVGGDLYTARDTFVGSIWMAEIPDFE